MCVPVPDYVLCTGSSSRLRLTQHRACACTCARARPSIRILVCHWQMSAHLTYIRFVAPFNHWPTRRLTAGTRWRTHLCTRGEVTTHNHAPAHTCAPLRTRAWCFVTSPTAEGGRGEGRVRGVRGGEETRKYPPIGS